MTGRRKFVSERLRNVYVTWLGHATNANKTLVGKHDGNRPLTRPRHRKEDDIKIRRGCRRDSSG